MDLLLPRIHVGIYPTPDEVSVSLFPGVTDLQVNLYAIGQLSPAEFFPNSNLKKK